MKPASTRSSNAKKLSRRSGRRLLPSATLIALAGLMSVTAFGQAVWDDRDNDGNPVGDGDWNNGANWSGDNGPSNLEVAILGADPNDDDPFISIITANTEVDIVGIDAQGLSPWQITFNNNLLLGNPDELIPTNSGIRGVGVDITIANGFVLDLRASQTFSNATINGVISGDDEFDLTIATVSGAIGGVTLNGANTYTGDTIIVSNVLDIAGTSASLSPNTDIIFNIDGNDGPIVAPGFANSTGATLNVANAVFINDTFSIRNGDLIEFDGDINFTPGEHVMSLSTLADATFTSVIDIDSINGVLTKVGLGNLEFANTTDVLTYDNQNGTTEISGVFSADTIRLGGDRSTELILRASGSFTAGQIIADGGAILNDTNGDLTIPEFIAFTNNLTARSTGTEDFLFTGAFDLSGGDGNHFFEVDGVDVSVEINSTISGGAFGMAGNGELLLTGVNAFTGFTKTGTGTVIFDGAQTLPNLIPVIIDGGSFDIRQSQEFSSLSGLGGDLIMGANDVLIDSSNNVDYAGIFTGTGQLTHRGTGVQGFLGDSAATYSGDVLLAGGGYRVVSGAFGTGDVTMTNGFLEADTTATLVNNINYQTQLIVAGNDDLTLSGVVTDQIGTGLRLQDNGDLFITNTNSRIAGPIIITGGVLNAETNVIAGNSSVDFSTTSTTTGLILNGDVALDRLTGGVAGGGVNGGDITFDQNTQLTVGDESDFTYNGIFQDGAGATGGIIKEGSGTWTITGFSTATGDNFVNDGELVMTDTARLNGNVTVNAGGALNNGGTVSGNLISNSGTLKPGAGVGTFTINGDLTATGTTRVEIELTGGSTFDNFAVAGATNFADTTTFAFSQGAGSSASIDDGDTFDFLVSGGGVTADPVALTANISQENPVYNFNITQPNANTLRATAAEVDVDVFAARVGIPDDDLAQGLFEVLTDAQGSAQLALAQQLFSAQNNGIQQFAQQTREFAELSAANSQINVTGVTAYTGVQSGYLSARRDGTMSTFAQADADQVTMLQGTQLASLATDPTALAQALAPMTQTQSLREYLLQERSDAGLIATEGLRDLGGYVKGYGIVSEGDTADFDADGWGVQAGIDFKTNDESIVGISFGYSEIDTETTGTDISTEAFRVGPYASLLIDEWFVDVSVTAGFHTSDQTRDDGLGGTATADFDAFDVTAYGAFGRTFDFGDLKLTPQGSIQYTYYDQDSITDTAGTIEGLQTSLLYLRAGGTAAWVLDFEDVTLVPEVSGGVEFEVLQENDTVAVTFPGFTTSSSVTTQLPDDVAVYVGTGVTALLEGQTSVYVRYDGTFGDEYTHHILSGGMTFRF